MPQAWLMLMDLEVMPKCSDRSEVAASFVSVDQAVWGDRGYHLAGW